MQGNELSLVLTQTVPLELTYREFSFEWSHHYVSSDSFGFLFLVKFAVGMPVKSPEPKFYCFDCLDISDKNMQEFRKLLLERATAHFHS